MRVLSFYLCLTALTPVLATAGPPENAAAIDPLFIAAPASLQPAQVAELQRRLRDWPQLGRYHASNARLPPHVPGRVVFYGDSITDGWGRNEGTTFFPGKPYVNRGISGQTTAQMLLRFRQDVIALKPVAVVILAGTNDIAGNSGLATAGMIQDNLRSMAELARANNIAVVLASILPVTAYPWRPGLQPAPTVKKLNTWIRDYARAHDLVYLDYYSALANSKGGLDVKWAADGVHPTAAAYRKMEPLAQRAIDQALAH